MLKKISIILFSLLLIQASSLACTDFLVKAKDGSVVVSRSMEFPLDLDSDIIIVPQGSQFGDTANQGKKYLNFKTKYGFLGINAFHLPNAFVEGFNEKGLSFGGLMFAGARYQAFVPGKTIPLDLFGTWIMGNFATVSEVKKALPNIVVCDTDQKKLKGMGMHVALHDALGQSLVIEFINGQMQVFDNPVGVMTNRPGFAWQMDNLRNYINLDPHDKKDKMLNNAKIQPTGVGSGLLGLPGDWTPPSRFVRMAIATDAALKPDNAADAINLSEHLLNIVDIPKGVIKEATPVPFVKMYGYASWVIIKDLANKVLYYKTYDNTIWKAVDLKKFALAPGSSRKTTNIDDGQSKINDISKELK